MVIRNVNGDNSIYQLQQSNETENNKEQVAAPSSEKKTRQFIADKLEISNEAKKLQTQEGGKDQIIKAKIANGYYNRPDTIRKVALAINKAFPSEGNLSK